MANLKSNWDPWFREYLFVYVVEYHTLTRTEYARYKVLGFQSGFFLKLQFPPEKVMINFPPIFLTSVPAKVGALNGKGGMFFLKMAGCYHRYSSESQMEFGF